MGDFERFISVNAEADVSRLLLSCARWPSIDDPFLAGFDSKELAVNTIQARRRLKDKVPEWYEISSLVYPTALGSEQCSSTVTARYKANLAKRILGEVVAAVKHNYSELGIRNVRYSDQEITSGSVSSVLGSFNPDIIFLDPARRSSDGNKVFLLEDCSPDVLSILPSLLASSRHLLLKLSPMADISMVVERLNNTYEQRDWVREIHVVACGGECKELLVWIDREWKGDYSITCREDGGSLSFGGREIRLSKPALPESANFKYIFEPGKSITKAGVLNILCERFDLVKLARFTQLLSFRDFSPSCSLSGISFHGTRLRSDSDPCVEWGNYLRLRRF